MSEYREYTYINREEVGNGAGLLIDKLCSPGATKPTIIRQGERPVAVVYPVDGVDEPEISMVIDAIERAQRRARDRAEGYVDYNDGFRMGSVF